MMSVWELPDEAEGIKVKAGRLVPFASCAAIGAASLAGMTWSPWMGLPAALFLALSVVGIRDLLQTRHSILRNYGYPAFRVDA